MKPIGILRGVRVKLTLHTCLAGIVRAEFTPCIVLRFAFLFPSRYSYLNALFWM